MIFLRLCATQTSENSPATFPLPRSPNPRNPEFLICPNHLAPRSSCDARRSRSALRFRHPLVHRPSQRLLPVARDRASMRKREKGTVTFSTPSLRSQGRGVPEPGGGELGGGMQQALDDQGQHQVALVRGLGVDQSGELQAADGFEDHLDMAMAAEGDSYLLYACFLPPKQSRELLVSRREDTLATGRFDLQFHQRFRGREKGTREKGTHGRRELPCRRENAIAATVYRPRRPQWLMKTADVVLDGAWCGYGHRLSRLLES